MGDYGAGFVCSSVIPHIPKLRHSERTSFGLEFTRFPFPTKRLTSCVGVDKLKHESFSVFTVLVSVQGPNCPKITTSASSSPGSVPFSLRAKRRLWLTKARAESPQDSAGK